MSGSALSFSIVMHILLLRIPFFLIAWFGSFINGAGITGMGESFWVLSRNHAAVPIAHPDCPNVFLIAQMYSLSPFTPPIPSTIFLSQKSDPSKIGLNISNRQRVTTYVKPYVPASNNFSWHGVHKTGQKLKREWH